MAAGPDDPAPVGAGGETAQAELALCDHCALPLRGLGAGRRSGSGSHAGAYCCAGCATAAALVGDGPDARAASGAERLLARVVLSAFLSMGVMVASLALYGEVLAPEGTFDGESAQALRGLLRAAALLLSLPVLHLLGVPLVRAALSTGRWFGSDLLVALGVGAAFAVSVWSTVRGTGEVYYESANMVLVLVGLGRWLDVRAKERAQAHVHDLARELQADALRLADDGTEEAVRPEALRVGNRVRVRAGDVLPVDGEVLEGRAFVEAASLTGEARPLPVGPGSEVLAGSTALDGTLVVRARAVGSGRVRAEVERELRAALARGGAQVALADRVARGLLPLVVTAALVAGVVHGLAGGPERGVVVALSVLLVSCPCALGIATPLAFASALGAAWRRGVLVRGGEVLERAAGVRRVLLDKTGTLTGTTPELVRVEVPAAAEGVPDERAALRLAAALERASDHPVARALRAAWGARDGLPAVEDARVVPGLGLEGRVEGRALFLGRPLDPGLEDAGQEHGVVELRAGDALLARFHLAAEPTATAREVVAELARRGLAPEVLTGDGPGPARALERALDVPVHARLLPGDKARRVEAAGGERVLFVGDGLNDVAALAAAGVGVAVGSGAPRNTALADAVLLGDDVAAVPALLDLGRRALRTARWNLTWAFAYNAAGLVLAVSGVLHPLAAAGAMVLSSASVALHTRRAFPEAGPLRSLREARRPGPGESEQAGVVEGAAAGDAMAGDPDARPGQDGPRAA